MLQKLKLEVKIVLKKEVIPNVRILQDLNSGFLKQYSDGDYVLVNYPVNNTEYRYARNITLLDEEDEDLTISFVKICDKEAHSIKLRSNKFILI